MAPALNKRNEFVVLCDPVSGKDMSGDIYYHDHLGKRFGG